MYNTGIHTVCVYCAASNAVDICYKEAAARLGRLIAERGSTIVCGAGNEGLMRSLADGALAAGGTVVGVIPQFMVDKGWDYDHLSKTIITADIHQRKKTMASLAHDVMALPGGCGTLEELLEIITWKQLGLFTGRIIIINIDGYYTPLLQMFDNAIEKGFIKQSHRLLWMVAHSVEEAISLLDANNPITEPKR